MKKRLLYALLFGIPGILWSLLVAAIIFGVLSGFFWLFVYGDSTWPQAAGRVLSVAFLLVFGDNTEDVLGKLRFLGLVALAAFVGSMAHIAGDPRAEAAYVGASGGISGIVAYYCLRFPQAKFGILVWWRWVRLPAGFMLVFWIVFQASGAMLQFSGFVDVSALSHLGGAVTGGIFWWVTRKSL